MNTVVGFLLFAAVITILVYLAVRDGRRPAAHVIEVVEESVDEAGAVVHRRRATARGH